MLVIITLVFAWALLLWLVVGLCASAHAGDAAEAPATPAAVSLGGPLPAGARPLGGPARPAARARAGDPATPVKAPPARRELSVTAARPEDLAA